MSKDGEIWDAFDQVMGEADKTFKATDKVFRMVGRRVREDGIIERQDGRLVVPLTWRNRLRLIGLAFSRAKRIRF